MKLKEDGEAGLYVNGLSEILVTLGVEWISVKDSLPGEFIYTAHRIGGGKPIGFSKDLLVTDGEIVYKSSYIENIGFGYPNILIDINDKYYPSDDVTHYAYVENFAR